MTYKVSNGNHENYKEANENATQKEAKKKHKWMNPKARGCCAYSPTIFEHYANVFTHAIFVIPSIFGAFYLSSYSKTDAQFKSVVIYGVSLILLFTVSTLFHIFSMINHYKSSPLKTFFHYCDRATIYIFIASSYTPWLYLRSTNTVYGQYMFSIVWIGAFLGIIYQMVFHEKYKILEIVFYLIIGICPSIVVIDMEDVSGLNELAIGGAMYVIGVLFFKSDGTIPFAHAIWHLFVTLGAAVHYYAIVNYLLFNTDNY